jgi:hypothetical protein
MHSLTRGGAAPQGDGQAHEVQFKKSAKSVSQTTIGFRFVSKKIKEPAPNVVGLMTKGDFYEPDQSCETA